MGCVEGLMVGGCWGVVLRDVLQFWVCGLGRSCWLMDKK